MVEIQKEVVEIPAEKAVWIDKSCCVVKLKEGVSIAIKVFVNKQILVNITDNNRFGNFYSCSKMEVPDQNEDDLFGEASAYDENEDDVYETQLLLGDRRSEKVADLFT